MVTLSSRASHKWTHNSIFLFTFVLIFLSNASIVHAVTLNAYPASEIYLSDYGTTLIWTQTLICDSLRVNATHANFTNVYIGLGNMFSILTISLMNANLTITELAYNNITTLSADSLPGQNVTVEMTVPASPVHVSIDGVDKAIGDGWQWNTAKDLLTVWYVLPVGHSTVTFTLDGTIGSVVPPSRLTLFLLPIFAAISLCGFIVIALVIIMFIKFQFDIKILLGIITFTVVLCISILFILYFIQGALNIPTS